MRSFVRPHGRRQGFTLAEVLAALAFMAIVLPVAVEGLRLASTAGELGQRRVEASLVAERLLNELVLAQPSQSASQNGVIQQGAREFRWLARMESWPEDSMSQLTIQVIFMVRGREYDFQLTTLLDTSTPS